MPPPSTTTSRPGRLLASLAALIIVMLLAVLGSNIGSPGNWHKSFRIGLGLDLSWGTQITLKAYHPVTKGGSAGAITAGAMDKAVQIMNNRIDSSGFVGATVVKQGNDEIVVSVPHENAEQVANLVGTTAQLSFRQVLYGAPNDTTTTTPSATPSTSTSPSAKASSSPSASASPTPTTSASSNGTGQAASASRLSAKAKSSASPSASASASPSPSASASGPTPGTKLSTTADGAGDLKALSAQTIADFNRLNCNNKHWQKAIYGQDPSGWNRPDQQAVSCEKYGTGWLKVAMAKPVIQGTDLSAVNAEAVTSGSGYQVVFNVKSPASTALGTLTETMSKYWDSTAGTADFYLNQLAVVLDGQVQSAPGVQGQITSSGEISGPSNTGFTQGQATTLANLLKYGQLPLSFRSLDSSSVSPQLGSAQLSAGIVAGIIGLILVVIYSFIYYRGLALVSVSSLAIAAVLTYLSVVLLSKYESFNLSLAGIAGLIVAIGITADSFVVYFERLRDEVREGRSLRSAVERGWTRARRTILVSDTVSFLAALLLYIFAIGDVRAFAFTLGLTTLIDIVVVFLFTKPMITLLARTRFYGQGHRLSGLDPARLGARAPWRGTRRTSGRPATGTAGGASAVSSRSATPGSSASPKEA